MPTVTTEGKIQVSYTPSPAQHYIFLCKTLRNKKNREGAACKKERRQIFKTQHIRTVVIIIIFIVGDYIRVLLLT